MFFPIVQLFELMNFLTKDFGTRTEEVNRKNLRSFYGWDSKYIGVFMVVLRLSKQWCTWLKLERAIGFFGNDAVVGYDIPVIGPVNWVEFWPIEAHICGQKVISRPDFKRSCFCWLTKGMKKSSPKRWVWSIFWDDCLV